MLRVRASRAALVAAVVVGAAWGPPTAAEAQEAYALDEDWPRYPADMVFEMGTGVAVGADGVVYTISRDVDHWAAHPLAMSRYRGRGTVARWDSSGRFLGTFGDDREFIGPHSMYVDPEGFVWVVDREGHQVVKLTPDGEAVLTLGEYGVFGDDEGHFNGPTGVAFLPDGRVVVSDGYWNSRLVWFDEDGNYLKEVGGLRRRPRPTGASARHRPRPGRPAHRGKRVRHRPAPLRDRAGADSARAPRAATRLRQPLRGVHPGGRVRGALGRRA